MSASTLAVRPVTALAPKSDLFTAHVGFVAMYLGRRIADCRGTATIAETAIRVLAEHGVAIDNTAAERIAELVILDTVFDSEDRMAARAAEKVLRDTFGDEMRLSGWIPGRQIARDGDVFSLVNDTCPSCEVNPLAYGHGGGVRCLNTSECGYWFCY